MLNIRKLKNMREDKTPILPPAPVEGSKPFVIPTHVPVRQALPDNTWF